MEITLEELRIQPDEIVSHIVQGDGITIMYNGKPYAKIVPLDDKSAESDDSGKELFGLWKDRTETDDTASYVRNMRQGRKL
jgi:antitoxin (DNA-binding transcriptional repressor) of toxin-antitoxin stability system